MARLRVDWLTVTSSMKSFAVTRRTDCLSISKSALGLLVSFSLLTAPVWAAPSSSLGVVVFADRAHVGAAQASVGATVFSGDRLSTEQTGSVQVRAGAARLLLSRSRQPGRNVDTWQRNFFDRQFECLCLARGVCRDSP
jgi:hypothetical protein